MHCMNEISLINEAFTPLSEQKQRGQSAPAITEKSDRPIVMPVPADVPPCTGWFSKYGGKPSHMWDYRDEAGNLLMHVARYDPPDARKQIVPWSWDGQKWRPRGIMGDTPRPLYGLDRLGNDGRPVLLVEGEKAADAAARLFPHWAVVTSQGGSGAARRANWSPLAGRKVTIWPDNDAPGDTYARDAIREMEAVGVADVRIVTLPSDLPDGWDLADQLPSGFSAETLASLLAAAVAPAPSTIVMPPGFSMMPNGLYFTLEGKDDTPIWIAGPFEVIAETRDADGCEWGLLIRWQDRDHKTHEWVVPRSLAHGDGRELAVTLEWRGLSCSTDMHRQLRRFVAQVKTSSRLRCVDRAGWHDTEAGPAFALPGGEVFGTNALVLRPGRAATGQEFASSGTLDGWQSQISAYAVGNSRLACFISAAFAGPLLDIVGDQSGGFHLIGGSQTGKSTAAFVAGSVWGRGDKGGQVRAWRGTANGLEGIAAETSDTVLILDEMGQASSKEIGDIIYLLGNGASKVRADRTGAARSIRTWRSLFLSTGERDLESMMTEAGKQVMAGQEVRLVNIPAAPEGGFGLYESLHDMPSGGALSDHLRVMARTHYGTPSREFLRRLVSDRKRSPEKLAADIREAREKFLVHMPEGADGQVRSVANRFALVACAGELATRYGVTGWPSGEAVRAAGVCFKAWLDQRGGSGAREDQTAIARVRAFIEQHGDGRFTILDRDRANAEYASETARPTINRLGFKRRKGTRDQCEWEYLFLPEMWRSEVCRGMDPARAARALRDAGFLIPDGTGGRLTKKVSIPNMGGKMNAYLIKGSILGAE